VKSAEPEQAWNPPDDVRRVGMLAELRTQGMAAAQTIQCLMGRP
jgi:hypothetical protein